MWSVSSLLNFGMNESSSYALFAYILWSPLVLVIFRIDCGDEHRHPARPLGSQDVALVHHCCQFSSYFLLALGLFGVLALVENLELRAHEVAPDFAQVPLPLTLQIVLIHGHHIVGCLIASPLLAIE